MKNALLSLATIAACIFCLMPKAALAGVIVQYDSAGDAQHLSLVGTTDTSLVALADAMTSIDGNGTILAGLHSSQTQVQGPLGTGNDLHFRFGGNGTAISYALTPANVAGGYWIGTSFTAAQALTLDELSFDLFVNSQSGSLYSARDVGLFASVDGGATFTQFGALATGGNGNRDITTFTDSLSVASGQTVDLRLLFTDKTSLATNLQASTRVGNIQISATAAPAVVPEPSSAVVVLGIAGVGFLSRRRK